MKKTVMMATCRRCGVKKPQYIYDLCKECHKVDFRKMDLILNPHKRYLEVRRVK